MASAQIQKQLDNIRKVLGNSPEGITAGVIQQAIDFKIGLRTILRRLEELEVQGEVLVTGSARSTRYKLIEKSPATLDTTRAKEPTIPLSPESEKILSHVTQPQQLRTPVTYHREFLENYEPNKTSYLTDADKKSWQKWGKHPARIIRLAQMPKKY